MITPSHLLRRRVLTDENPDLGFQIAPMIDVVFVVLVFFMSQTLAIKVEEALNTTLPGTASASAPVNFPDEQFIVVSADGQVSINDDPCGAPGDTALRELVDRLKRLKANADASKTTLLVTLQSEPEAPYYRTVDAMNALAAASVVNVTFAVDDSVDP